MSNISLSSSSEKQKTLVSNSHHEENISMGLTYALGPFPDEPLLSIIDKTLLLSSRFQRNSRSLQENTKKPLSFSIGTECPKESLPKLPDLSLSCPDLSIISSEETLTEKIVFPSKVSSHSDVVEQCLDKKSSHVSQSDIASECLMSSKPMNDIVKQCPLTFSKDSLNRMRVEKKITSNGIKSYEIWSEDICKDSPSMIFILSPRGEVIPFEYLPNNKKLS